MINEMTIRCFLSLSETLSFTQTAKDLFLTQQAVSKQIATLESSLGFPLFVRTKHFVVLTDMGKVYKEFFTLGEKRWHELRELCSSSYREKSSTIKIGFVDSTDYKNMANVGITQLLAKFPSIDIQIIKASPMNLADKLEKGLVDIIVTYNRYAYHAKTYKSAYIHDLTFCLVTSDNNPATRDAASWTDCARCPLMFDTSEFETRTECLKRAKHTTGYLGLNPEEIIIVDDFAEGMRNVMAGKGVIICTDITYVPEGAGLRRFPTEKNDTLVCIWRVEHETEAILHFANSLSGAYDKFGNDK
ncbi:MAG: LysR family transcriptional regulator [Oscillospiraceae bacterium]|nr:LysR family transcriptional regulator [Oscillospiraceae bacterium]